MPLVILEENPEAVLVFLDEKATGIGKFQSSNELTAINFLCSNFFNFHQMSLVGVIVCAVYDIC